MLVLSIIVFCSDVVLLPFFVRSGVNECGTSPTSSRLGGDECATQISAHTGIIEERVGRHHVAAKAWKGGKRLLIYCFDGTKVTVHHCVLSEYCTCIIELG